MKLPFLPLPGHTDITPRPVVTIDVEGLVEAPLHCLIDTGSLHNRFGAWVAHWAGVDLGAVEYESIGVGGRSLLGRTVTTRLRIGAHDWEAPVTYCESWPFDFQVLGQDGFFRWFEVTLRAADRQLEVTPA